VNDATSVVLFRAVQTYNFDNFTPLEGLQIGGSFLYLFFLSCILGIVVSISCPPIRPNSVGSFLRLEPAAPRFLQDVGYLADVGRRIVEIGHNG